MKTFRRENDDEVFKSDRDIAYHNAGDNDDNRYPRLKSYNNGDNNKVDNDGVGINDNDGDEGFISGYAKEFPIQDKRASYRNGNRDAYRDIDVDKDIDGNMNRDMYGDIKRDNVDSSMDHNQMISSSLQALINQSVAEAFRKILIDNESMKELLSINALRNDSNDIQIKSSKKTKKLKKVKTTLTGTHESPNNIISNRKLTPSSMTTTSSSTTSSSTKNIKNKKIPITNPKANLTSQNHFNTNISSTNSVTSLSTLPIAIPTGYSINKFTQEMLPSLTQLSASNVVQDGCILNDGFRLHLPCSAASIDFDNLEIHEIMKTSSLKNTSKYSKSNLEKRLSKNMEIRNHGEDVININTNNIKESIQKSHYSSIGGGDLVTKKKMNSLTRKTAEKASNIFDINNTSAASILLDLSPSNSEDNVVLLPKKKKIVRKKKKIHTAT